ncbi:Hypothetical predicted protein [Cloeon dipterum]|uniref:Nose resistant-to-fluoxetine protein N-terminal domain-containing protein n=1 Tax=Cloeon dipterum TaxID=197152 RepID=A0A8S1CSY6_9INSE|nr:Hypothetical predicted protein [Cloeon dipterum]
MGNLKVLLCLNLVLFPLSWAQVLTPPCAADVGRTLIEAAGGEEWALRMIDATSKFPDGILVGNVVSFGHWDECVQVSSGNGIEGKYCRVSATYENTEFFDKLELEKITKMRSMRAAPAGTALVLKFGLCLPQSCTTDDFVIVAEQLLPVLDNATQLSVTVNHRECNTQESVNLPIDGGTIAATVVFSMLIALVVVATILEHFNKGGTVVKALSMKTTYNDLVRVREGSFDSVNGLKVLSMLWIMVGHRYDLGALSTASSNIALAIDMTQNPLFQLLSNVGYLAVDSFYQIGGFLLAFGFFRDMKRGATFDAFKFYLYRYIRITAPLSIMIVFYVTILRYIGEGPEWYRMVYLRFIHPCETYWWAAITYVNNYVGGLEQCVEQTWYTSLDMQMAWLSPLLLLPMHYSPRAGKQLAFLVAALSCAIPAAITYINNYPWGPNNVNYDHYSPLIFTYEVYLPTHTRCSPYIAGVILGYIMANTPRKMYFNWKTVALGWILCAGIMLSVVFLFAITLKYDYVYEPIAAMIYGGFHRFAWAVGLCWIIFACSKGIGGPVNAILSWRLFNILAPVIYGVFLVHFMVIAVQAGSKRHPDTLEYYDVIHKFLGDIPFSFIGGAALYFVVEAPVMVFMRIIFKKQRPARPASK